MKKESKSEGSALGRSLRYWRKQKKVSQLSLALDSGISSRHISFIETGKSQPSPEVVKCLAMALRLSLRQMNALLLAAGYVPEAPHGYASPQMEKVRAALKLLLDQHEPFPAMVTNPGYDVIMTNQGFQTLVSLFLSADEIAEHQNFYRLAFAKDGLQPYFEDWPQVSTFLLARLQQEALVTENLAIQTLFADLMRQTGRDPGQSIELDESHDLPMFRFRLRKESVVLHFFSNTTTFGAPRDIAVEDLRIDTLFPVDDATRQVIISSLLQNT